MPVEAVRAKTEHPEVKKSLSNINKPLRDLVHKAKDMEQREVFQALKKAAGLVELDNPPLGDTDSLIKGEMSTLYQELLKTLATIQALTKTDDASHNKEILFLMRKALKNPAYQLLKHDESHPAVKLIHNLALASYVEPKVLKAFTEIGNILHDDSYEGLSLADKLKHSRGVGYKKGLIKDDRSRTYIVNYFTYVIASFFSTKFGTKVGSFFGKAYDPRGELSNNAGALYDETMQVGKHVVTLRTVYTPLSNYWR